MGEQASLRQQMQWSPVYRPAWDEAPDAYRATGSVGWGRSRRLGRLVVPALGLVCYVGVQHLDPGRWGLSGEPVSRFFASVRQGRQSWLRTFATMPAALAAIDAARATAGRRGSGACGGGA